MMQIVYARCAGLDVHKKTVVVCARLVSTDGTLTTHIRTFGTTTAELLNLVAWLLALEVTHIAMESTGEFWKPVYNLLEGSFTVLVVNAAHIKYVPGRKTDVKDAEWIAELLAHGLLRPSFVPPAPQRALRDLTRQRTHLIQERASVVNRMQKVLEWANIKLASVVTDITGVSAQAILDAIPGIGLRVAETILAELGTDMSRFPDAAHASSWAGLAPSQHESAGKRKRTRIRDGNKYLRSALIQAAWAAVKQPDTFLAVFYRRLAARRGKKKAIVALAHKILVIVYTLLKTGQVYQERGAAALDEHQKERIVHRLERRIAQLGYTVHLEPVTAAAS
jgi:transposase